MATSIENMKIRSRLSDAGLIAVRLLEAVNETADVLPQLKSASGGVLHIARLIERFHANKKDWADFLEHVGKCVALITQSRSAANQAPGNQAAATPLTPATVADDFVDSLKDLNELLDKIKSKIERLQGSSLWKRFFTFWKDPKRIDGMKEELVTVRDRFHLEKDLQISADVDKTVKYLREVKATLENIDRTFARMDAEVSDVNRSMGDMGTTVRGIRTDVQQIAQIASISRMVYAEGASWDIGQICQAGTREPILAEIMEWIGNFPVGGAARIFCLTGAPGAGKTSIAHSVSQRCHGQGWLVTSFFFNREISTRASLLFSTMICDLAARFPVFKESISQAIEEDPSLASASLAHQFHKLLVPFCSHLPKDKPVVIVLDALDEGFSDTLLKILAKEVTKLPGVLQFVVTSREVVEIKELLAAPHVYHKRFDHSEGTSLEDVGKVIHEELGKVAESKDLVGWPKVDTETQMRLRSGGLMVWVVVVCQYLKQPELFDPQNDLEALLENTLPGDLGAEEQMDNLYPLCHYLGEVEMVR